MGELMTPLLGALERARLVRLGDREVVELVDDRRVVRVDVRGLSLLDLPVLGLEFKAMSFRSRVTIGGLAGFSLVGGKAELRHIRRPSLAKNRAIPVREVRPWSWPNTLRIFGETRPAEVIGARELVEIGKLVEVGSDVRVSGSPDRVRIVRGHGFEVATCSSVSDWGSDW